jgi:hypothetical protein
VRVPSRRLVVLVAGAVIVLVAGAVTAFAVWSSRQAPKIALHRAPTSSPSASASLGNPFGDVPGTPTPSPTIADASIAPTTSAHADNGVPPRASGTPNPNQARLGTGADGRPILASNEVVPGHATEPGGVITSTWTWDGTQWRWLRSDPHADVGGNIVYDPGLRKVVGLAGGITGIPYTMWGYDGAGWAQLHPATVPSPGYDRALLSWDPPRHQLVALVPETFDTSSTWTFDGVTWMRSPTAINPPARRRASMAYDNDTVSVVLYGGDHVLAGAGSQLNDTWSWDGTTWTEKHPATTPGGCAAQLAYDAATSQMLLFCQGSAGVTMWTWTGTTWTQLHPSTMPPVAWEPMMTYDAVRGELVYFGQPEGSPASQTWKYAKGQWKQVI